MAQENDGLVDIYFEHAVSSPELLEGKEIVLYVDDEHDELRVVGESKVKMENKTNLEALKKDNPAKPNEKDVTMPGNEPLASKIPKQANYPLSHNNEPRTTSNFNPNEGNMNSETVSNLVTTGVGSEAAPVEIDEPSSKRLRQATSNVWNFFKKLGPDKDGVERAECKGCKKVFKAGESSSQLSSNFSQATSSAIGTQLIKIVGDLMSRNQEAEVKSGKNQLDIYLSEATLFCNDAIIDVLQWWKDNHHRFPTLSLMARDLLSIPITTVASESAFSMGSHVLNKYRSRLLSDNVEAVICTRNWIRGYDDFEEDKDQEDIAKGEGYSSGVGSNDVIDLYEDEDEN
nr:uncharacterized protein LOC112754573 [Arachis hypogaea]